MQEINEEMEQMNEQEIQEWESLRVSNNVVAEYWRPVDADSPDTYCNKRSEHDI